MENRLVKSSATAKDKQPNVYNPTEANIDSVIEDATGRPVKLDQWVAQARNQ
jgi:hypothetical protein